MVSPPDTFLLAILEVLGSNTPTLGGSSVGLIAAPFTPARNLTVAGLTEANYDGYAKQTCNFGAFDSFTSTDGFDYVEGDLLRFTPTGSATPNTIYGYFGIYGHDSTKLAFVEPINPPVTLNGPFTSLSVIPRFGLNPTFSFGAGIVGS